MIFNNLSQTNQGSVGDKGRIIGIDVGTKRIGIAICDSTRFIASPKMVLSRQGNKADFAKIAQIISENEIVAIVVGFPTHMDGSDDEMTEFVRRFAANLDEFLEKKFPIFLFEERLTSFEARQINASELSRKKNKFVDDIAASLILQHFLDDLKNGF